MHLRFWETAHRFANTYDHHTVLTTVNENSFTQWLYIIKVLNDYLSDGATGNSPPGISE